MIEKKEKAILLFSKLSSDNNLYVKFLTHNDEMLTGISFGASSKKNKNIYQIGYFFNIIINKKNNNFPNNISGELAKPFLYNIFNDKYKLHCLLSIVSLLNISIIEGQRIEGIFKLSEKMIDLLSNKEKWIIDYFLYLLNLLKLIGYDIDFKKNLSKNIFNLETLQFENTLSSNSIKFPHQLLYKLEKINSQNANSFFKIFEIIIQNHHLNNINFNIPVNYFKFKKLILDCLNK